LFKKELTAGSEKRGSKIAFIIDGEAIRHVSPGIVLLKGKMKTSQEPAAKRSVGGTS